MSMWVQKNMETERDNIETERGRNVNVGAENMETERVNVEIERGSNDLNVALNDVDIVEDP
jgi:hypothetical protein